MDHLLEEDSSNVHLQVAVNVVVLIMILSNWLCNISLFYAVLYVKGT